jgi:hypothetical protein
MGYNGIAPIFFKGLSNVTAVPDVQLGTRRLENGEEYVYCYNNTGSSVTAGAMMTTSGLSGFSFTRSTTAAADIPMVAVKHVAVPAGEYFWGLVRGSVRVLSATISAGNCIQVGTDGVVTSAPLGSFPTGIICGKMLEAASGSTQSLAFVRLFG